MVQKGLKGPPFELLLGADLRFVSLKTVLLLALASAKCVSDIQATVGAPIPLAYSSHGLQPPEGLRAHSTRGLAKSWALFRGVDRQEICDAASWSSRSLLSGFICWSSVVWP